MRAALLTLLATALVAACGGSKSGPQSTSGPRANNDWVEKESGEPAQGSASVTQASTTAPTAATEKLSTCKQRRDGAFDLSAEDLLLRRGLDARAFGDVATTAETPIEVCGTKGELDWLLRVTCADGSRPWGHDKRKAHASRNGSRPAKSRCGTTVMIDDYDVPCPEKHYTIFMNMYECGPGESLWPQ